MELSLSKYLKDEKPLPVAILAGGLLAFFLTVLSFYLIAIIIYWFSFLTAFPIKFDFHIPISGIDAFTGLVFAPLIETLILAVPLILLTRLTANRILIATFAGLLSGYLHIEGKGYLVFLPVSLQFFVYSYLFLSWLQRSFLCAYAAAALPHATVNLLLIVLQLLANRLLS